MLIIPLQAVSNQTVTVNLAGQVTQLDVYQEVYGLFTNVYVDNVLIVGGVLCQNLNRVVRSVYLGFVGDLIFIDNEGDTDPVYTGLGQTGSRYSLAYLEASDLAGAG